jgi:glycosyltransferase involved in cell wall biosynthesis
MFLILSKLVWNLELTKVLRIITRMNIGGPSKQIQTLNSIFVESDLQQLIITGSVDKSEKEIDLSVFSNVIQVKSLARNINPINDLVALIRICFIVLRYKPDVIHTHLSKAWVIGRIAKIIAAPKAKTVHTFHGHILHSYFSRPIESALIFLQRITAVRQDVLVAVSEEVKFDLLAKKIGRFSQYKVIEPGFIAPVKFETLSARATLGLQQDLFTVGYIGRFEKIKRPDILESVIRESNTLGNSLQFIVCGGGSLFDQFVENSRKYGLVSLNWMSDPSIFYSAIDLLILVSDNEGTPLTIIEAGKLGVPTITRNVGGIRGMLLNKENGFLIEDNPLKIAEELVALSNNPKIIEEVSQRAKIYFEAHFNEKKFLNEYRELYLSL